MAEAKEYLTFTLGTETFALEVAMVREVVDYSDITEVPLMPGYLPGVFNLRGTIISVISLHLMLGLPGAEKTKNTCIIITETNADGELLLAGSVADSVHEVIYLDENQIGPPPLLGTKINTEFVRGIGNRGNSFVIILNIEKVLSVIEAEISVASNENSRGSVQEITVKI